MRWVTILALLLACSGCSKVVLSFTVSKGWSVDSHDPNPVNTSAGLQFQKDFNK